VTLLFAGIPFFILRMVSDKVNMLNACYVILDKSDAIAANFFHVIMRTAQASCLQGLLHVLELFQDLLLHALVEAFEVAVPAGLEVKSVRN